jgi:hypothetical protein
MAKPYYHAQSSAKKYGGIWEDYIEIHNFIDSSKAAFPDNRHRVLTHNSWFIGFVLPRVFGETFNRASDGKIVNTRDIGEQHVLEDYKFRFIPTAADFIAEMEFLPWMQNGEGKAPHSHKKLSKPEPAPVLVEEEEKRPQLEILFPETNEEPIQILDNPQVIFPRNDRMVYDGMMGRRGGYTVD